MKAVEVAEDVYADDVRGFGVVVDGNRFVVEMVNASTYRARQDASFSYGGAELVDGFGVA